MHFRDSDLYDTADLGQILIDDLALKGYNSKTPVKRLKPSPKKSTTKSKSRKKRGKRDSMDIDQLEFDVL